QRHVGRIRQQWQSADQTVTLTPIRTICHGHYPPGPTTERIVGALGVVDGALTFRGQRADALDFATPLTAIRWIGQRTLVKHSWNRRLEWPELIIHAETEAGWRVYTFTEGPITALATRLAELVELNVQEIGEAFEDFGPHPAIHLIEDAAGAWQRCTDPAVDLDDLPEEWDGIDHTLYLTPDRLLYDWSNAIPLTSIRRVDVYPPQGDSRNPFDLPLLRLEWADEANTRRVVGFLTRAAGDWAGVLDHRLDVPVTHYEVRDAG
ncbi:MAG: hypothetical protein JXA10_17825, partial [Anaerolineae bacterium]|nr:hypothetical protein [Anaerolineae bacterium]